jgi:hypothetical protein
VIELDAAEILRVNWLDGADTITSREMVLASCLVYGKGDRIRLVPHQGQTGSPFRQDNYQIAWEMLAATERLPAICGFCLNVVTVDGGQAEIPGKYRRTHLSASQVDSAPRQAVAISQ